MPMQPRPTVGVVGPDTRGLGTVLGPVRPALNARDDVERLHLPILRTAVLNPNGRKRTVLRELPADFARHVEGRRRSGVAVLAESPQCCERLDASPVKALGGAPLRPVEGPSSVVLLFGSEAAKVGLDLLAGEDRPAWPVGVS